MGTTSNQGATVPGVVQESAKRTASQSSYPNFPVECSSTALVSSGAAESAVHDSDYKQFSAVQASPRSSALSRLTASTARCPLVRIETANAASPTLEHGLQVV